MIQSFNDAHKDQGVQIRMEVIPLEQYPTKVLASAVTGQAPDFGWGTAGLNAKFAKDEVIVRSTRSRARSGSISPTSPQARSRRRAIRSSTTSSTWCRWT